MIEESNATAIDDLETQEERLPECYEAPAAQSDQPIHHLQDHTSTEHQRYEQVGDPLDEDPTDNILRVYIQNLNGLRWDQDGGQ